MDQRSIFAAAGGEPGMLALAAAHHRRCLADPVLNHPFAHHADHDSHVRRLAAYWTEVFGGPPRYTEAGGDQSGVLGIHAGQGMQTDLGERFLAAFVGAVAEALPDDPRLRSSLRAYMAAAVDEVMGYSPAGSAVPPGLGVPRWTWDGPAGR
jgi:hemoglobin